MKEKNEELQALIEKYKLLLEEKDNIIKENEYYQMEYEKIKYSFSYRLMNKVKKIMTKIGLYQVFRSLLNVAKKIRNSRRIKIEKLVEYKYFRFKRDRKNIYSFDSNAIEHNYINKLVSIVLPVYNADVYLEQTIQSILKQSYKNFELIIVNDGSTDNSLEIANKYAKKDKRIIVISQENSKLPVAISNGFRIAKGEYYMWVGADDILHKDCIKSLVNDLEKDKTVDFVFPNVRLINENGEPIKDNKWYNCDKEHPEYVILPTRMYNFNVEKNNYIAPIALYKAIVVKTLGDFSANRFTVEDYEYWMRINNIFNIKHTSFVEPVFDYRRHSQSLTSQAKELNIAQKTNDLMMYEDFRRDYLMSPLIWVIDTEDKDNKLYIQLKDCITNAGHLIWDREDAFRDSYSSIYRNQVYIYIGDAKAGQSKSLSDIPNDVYKILLSDNQKNSSNDFNLYLTINGKSTNDLGNYKGWFKIKDIQNTFSFIDVKVKHNYLQKMETVIESDTDDSEKKLSIVICTYMRSEKLNNAIKSSINQTASKKDYEVLVINNDIKNKEIYDIVAKYRKEYHLSSSFLKYYEAPIKGLSFGRNVGLFVAKGKRILYLDDDSIAFDDLVEQMIKAYEDNPNAGVVGGQIILKLPNKHPDFFLKGKETYWSQFLIEGKNYKKVKEWYEFPYGANFSVQRKALLKIGGFRIGYGRIGHNFTGGEEIVVSSIIRKLTKDIVLAPLAKVYHDVDISRYTKEHVEKTDKGNAYTRIKMELDLYSPVYYLLNRNVKREIKYLKQQLANANGIKEKTYIKSNLKGHKIGLYELKNVARDIKKLK